MRKSAHVRWIAGAYAVLTAVNWAAEALTGWEGAGSVLFPFAVLGWWRTWHPYDVRHTREATAAALRRHEDPGAELREATGAHARESLARSPWPARGLALVLLALAVACASVGWQGGDAWDAAPVPILLAVAVGAVVVDRVSRQRARRWLADPPYAAQRVEPPS